MTGDEELTAKSWVELPTKARSKAQRWHVFRNWVLGNGLLESVPDTHGMTEEKKTKGRDSVFEAAERGISALRQKPTMKTISDSINWLIDGMRKRGPSKSTIFGHRFKLVKFFRYMGIPQEVLGSERLDQMVRDVLAARATDDKLLNSDEIKACLIHGDAKQKVAVSFSVCTGAGIGETCKVKLSDIFWNETPVRVQLERPRRPRKIQLHQLRVRSADQRLHQRPHYRILV